MLTQNTVQSLYLIIALYVLGTQQTVFSPGNQRYNLAWCLHGAVDPSMGECVELLGTIYQQVFIYTPTSFVLTI